ncbi:XRE family transcriptional regulator [Planosporangium flavigriseum]|uniref:Cupin n=1 Tax=Planosporangium flavigriseum TaxID=373681 RepID=A0A8J3LMP2_9ACTN|nr:cupin [Planosporangium flavigriseum]
MAGSIVRAARTRRRMTLRQLSTVTGLSESFLSQFERGLSQASIASLRSITGAVGITLADVFTTSGAAGARVLRQSARPTMPFGDNAVKYLLTPHPMRHLEAFCVTFQPNGSTGDTHYTHGDSEELLLVTSGAVKLELSTDVFLLEAGDSIAFWSSVPHRVVNVSQEPSQALWVISSPSN